MWGAQVLRYVGGEITTPRTDPHGRRRVVIFVHGFNNDKEQAEQNYRDLVNQMPPNELGIVDDVWQFFWPSFVANGAASEAPLGIDTVRDDAGAHSNEPLSIPTYPIQVYKAVKVGAALGNFCKGLRGTQVVFVAHSLGCRVVLEAVRAWKLADEEKNLHVACLMAAAVPVRRVWKSGRHLYDAAVAVRSSVLYSPKDGVLQVWFRLGEMGPFQGILPQAVGTWGRPYATWPRRYYTGLGHSDYWSHGDTGPAVLRSMNRETEHTLAPASLDAERKLPVSAISRARGLVTSTLASAVRWF